MISTPRLSKQFFLILLLLCAFIRPAFSQFAIENVKEIPRLKKSVTYVAMKDTSTAIAEIYKTIYRRYWTCSDLKFIEYRDLTDYISPDASFFSIGGYTTNSTMSGGTSYSNTHIYLELWMCNPEELEKWKNRKKKKSDDELPSEVKQLIGRVELFTDFETLSKPENLYKSDYDGGGHIRNWGPGYLKNYLQVLMALLEKETAQTIYKGSMNKKEMKNLKKQTLYVPDYVLIKFGKFTGDESKVHKEKDLLGDYKYPWKMLTNKELNKKILEDPEPFYYMIYVKSSTDKFISVYNSQTGDLIYTTYSAVSYNIKDKDFERLADSIEGK